MIKVEISDNELVTLMLCSDLALCGEEKPYSDAAYSAFAKALYLSENEPADLFNMNADDIQTVCKDHAQFFSRIRRKDFDLCVPRMLKRHQQIIVELNELMKKGISVVTRANKSLYPAILRRKLLVAGIPIPAFIYYSGNISLVDRFNSLAVVGSRNLEKDSEAVLFTEKVVKKALKSGYAIASGGANGVDSIAQDATLSSGGFSIICVSDSLLKKIQKAEIKHAILDELSVYLSLVNPKQRFLSYNAMARNKIIYAVSRYAMVVSCDYHTKLSKGEDVIDNNKGGTWVGANECAEKKLSELIIRVDGQKTPRGNLRLMDTVQCLEINESNLEMDMNFDDMVKSLKKHSGEKEFVQSDLLFTPSQSYDRDFVQGSNSIN